MSTLDLANRYLAGQIEKYGDADQLPYHAGSGAVVTGGRFVASVAGDRKVAIAGADSPLVQGVAMWSIGATDTERQVTVFGTGVVVMVRAAGAIGAGERLKSGALGVAVEAGAAADPAMICAVALADIADGADGPARLL